MDRYLFEGPYKEHFACFRCRKSFKRAPEEDIPEEHRTAPHETHVVLCPQCGSPMSDVGRDFEAPKQSDEKQWKVVDILTQHGIKLAGWSGPRPAEVKDLEAYLGPRLLDSEGKRLLRKIKQRTQRSRRRR